VIWPDALLDTPSPGAMAGIPTIPIYLNSLKIFKNATTKNNKSTPESRDLHLTGVGKNARMKYQTVQRCNGECPIHRYDVQI